MRFFQYGVGILPAGAHQSLLAVTTVGVEDADGVTSVWKVTERGAEDAGSAAPRLAGTGS
jgi:hypothetical protein